MKQNHSEKRRRSSFHLSLRVLGYVAEDGLWAAHCLETDLVGYGKNFTKAVNELMELTEMQISFAIQVKQPSLLYHPAPMHIIESYNSLVQSTLMNYAVRGNMRKDQRLASLPLPEKINKVDHAFVQTQAI